MEREEMEIASDLRIEIGKCQWVRQRSTSRQSFAGF